MSAIKLLVGLGNPGPTYHNTRHNIGARFVEDLAQREQIPLAEETKFKARIGRGFIGGVDVRLMIPTTYMNDSGDAVGAVTRFYKWDVEEILVAFDEMAFAPGTVKLKTGGGDNGHNGIRSIVRCLGNNKQFHRLRIGVGHPGQPSKVTAFLTSHNMPESERNLVEDALHFSTALTKNLFSGDFQSAMLELHWPPPSTSSTESPPKEQS